MIEYKVGDILAEDAQALVNTVNCVGVMGRGVSLQFKKAEQFSERQILLARKVLADMNWLPPSGSDPDVRQA